MVTRLHAFKQGTGMRARPLRLDQRAKDGQDVQHAPDLFRVGFHARQDLPVAAGNAGGIEKREIRGVIPFLEVENLLEIGTVVDRDAGGQPLQEGFDLVAAPIFHLRPRRTRPPLVGL